VRYDILVRQLQEYGEGRRDTKCVTTNDSDFQFCRYCEVTVKLRRSLSNIVAQARTPTSNAVTVITRTVCRALTVTVKCHSRVSFPEMWNVRCLYSFTPFFQFAKKAVSNLFGGHDVTVIFPLLARTVSTGLCQGFLAHYRATSELSQSLVHKLHLFYRV
jgi:hypothetical protein